MKINTVLENLQIEEVSQLPEKALKGRAIIFENVFYLGDGEKWAQVSGASDIKAQVFDGTEGRVFIGNDTYRDDRIIKSDTQYVELRVPQNRSLILKLPNFSNDYPKTGQSIIVNNVGVKDGSGVYRTGAVSIYLTGRGTDPEDTENYELDRSLWHPYLNTINYQMPATTLLNFTKEEGEFVENNSKYPKWTAVNFVSPNLLVDKSIRQEKLNSVGSVKDQALVSDGDGGVVFKAVSMNTQPGVTRIDELLDVPNSKLNQAGKVLTVDTDETRLVYKDRDDTFPDDSEVNLSRTYTGTGNVPGIARSVADVIQAFDRFKTPDDPSSGTNLGDVWVRSTALFTINTSRTDKGVMGSWGGDPSIPTPDGIMQSQTERDVLIFSSIPPTTHTLGFWLTLNKIPDGGQTKDAVIVDRAFFPWGKYFDETALTFGGVEFVAEYKSIEGGDNSLKITSKEAYSTGIPRDAMFFEVREAKTSAGNTKPNAGDIPLIPFDGSGTIESSSENVRQALVNLDRLDISKVKVPPYSGGGFFPRTADTLKKALDAVDTVDVPGLPSKRGSLPSIVLGQSNVGNINARFSITSAYFANKEMIFPIQNINPLAGSRTGTTRPTLSIDNAVFSGLEVGATLILYINFLLDRGRRAQVYFDVDQKNYAIEFRTGVSGTMVAAGNSRPTSLRLLETSRGFPNNSTYSQTNVLTFIKTNANTLSIYEGRVDRGQKGEKGDPGRVSTSSFPPLVTASSTVFNVTSRSSSNVKESRVLSQSVIDNKFVFAHVRSTHSNRSAQGVITINSDGEVGDRVFLKCKVDKNSSTNARALLSIRTPNDHTLVVATGGDRNTADISSDFVFMDTNVVPSGTPYSETQDFTLVKTKDPIKGSGEWTLYSGIFDGAKGERGEQGLPGPEGPQGPAGEVISNALPPKIPSTFRRQLFNGGSRRITLTQSILDQKLLALQLISGNSNISCDIRLADIGQVGDRLFIAVDIRNISGSNNIRTGVCRITNPRRSGLILNAYVPLASTTRITENNTTQILYSTLQGPNLEDSVVGNFTLIKTKEKVGTVGQPGFEAGEWSVYPGILTGDVAPSSGGGDSAAPIRVNVSDVATRTVAGLTDREVLEITPERYEEWKNKTVYLDTEEFFNLYIKVSGFPEFNPSGESDGNFIEFVTAQKVILQGVYPKRSNSIDIANRTVKESKHFKVLSDVRNVNEVSLFATAFKTITGEEIQDGTIRGQKLAANSITKAKIVENSVGSEEIINGSVGFDELPRTVKSGLPGNFKTINLEFVSFTPILYLKNLNSSTTESSSDGVRESIYRFSRDFFNNEISYDNKFILDGNRRENNVNIELPLFNLEGFGAFKNSTDNPTKVFILNRSNTIAHIFGAGFLTPSTAIAVEYVLNTKTNLVAGRQYPYLFTIQKANYLSKGLSIHNPNNDIALAPGDWAEFEFLGNVTSVDITMKGKNSVDATDSSAITPLWIVKGSNIG